MSCLIVSDSKTYNKGTLCYLRERAVTQGQGQDEVLLTANLKRNMFGAASIKLFFCKGKKGRPSLVNCYCETTHKCIFILYLNVFADRCK